MSDQMRNRCASAQLWVIRTDAGSTIGLGHLKRCLILAGECPGAVRFAMAEWDEPSRATIERAGYYFQPLDNDPVRQMSALLTGDPSAVIFDISHRVSAAARLPVCQIVDQCSEKVATIVIDGLEGDALAADLRGGQARIIVPYAGVSRSASSNFYSGAEYFVLDSAYRDAAKGERDHPDVASRLLVTGGGGDPAGITALTLQAIAFLSLDIASVDVVVGASFKPALVTELRTLASSLPCHVRLHEAPENLASLMNHNHMAVAATGLTKYELAAMQLPSIQLSPDEVHHIANSGFARLNTAHYLGMVDDIDASRLGAEIENLARDRDMRRKLADSGANLVDGEGAARIVKLLTGMITEYG